MEQEDTPAKQQGNTGANADHQQHRPAMVLDVEECFLEGVLCFLRCTFRRGRCVFAVFSACRSSFA